MNELQETIEKFEADSRKQGIFLEAQQIVGAHIHRQALLACDNEENKIPLMSTTIMNAMKISREKLKF